MKCIFGLMKCFSFSLLVQKNCAPNGLNLDDLRNQFTNKCNNNSFSTIVEKINMGFGSITSKQIRPKNQ